MPYAILSGVLPAARMGVYMGIFNFFIVIPEILASLALEPVVAKLFDNDPVKVVMLGGGCLVVAAIFTQFVHEPNDADEPLLDRIAEEELNPQSVVPPESPPV
jgi:maltose/moltooligosaccharide transporter